VATTLRNAAAEVHEAIIPGACHWLLEEAPEETIAAVRDFIGAE
jgi:pimeloyl-ACP methyl ester carboxylesterase